MRPILPVLLLLVVSAGCGGGSPAAVSTIPPIPPSPSSPTSSSASVSPTHNPSPQPVSPTPAPVVLPRGVPASYAPDDEPGDVPPSALVPRDATVTGTWFARSPSGSDTAILVTYARGGDPFAREQGFVVWRRFPTRPHWRATFGFSDPARVGVLAIRVDVGDATGDGLPDALTFESIGGTGDCGAWRLIQIASATAVQVEPPGTCDVTVEISTDPVGLLLTKAIFRPGDAHCCPSAFRTIQLEWNGEGFDVTKKRVSPAP
ncbi:MAG: hypothetical protein HY240_00320 [Actinobacteria bacterium]|nr:hypothetical protein [Actinomycetota bacterium]